MPTALPGTSPTEQLRRALSALALVLGLALAVVLAGEAAPAAAAKSGRAVAHVARCTPVASVTARNRAIRRLKRAIAKRRAAIRRHRRSAARDRRALVKLQAQLACLRAARIARRTSTAPIPHGPLAIGLNANTQAWGTDVGAEQDRVAQTGVRWLREEFDWAAIEPQRGQWDWSRYDNLFEAAARRGMHVLPVLMTQPSWTGQGTDALPTDPAAFADFTAHVVARYGPGGTFWSSRPDLPADAASSYFEVWNEPYLAPFATNGANPGVYARLVKAAVRAGRAANPGARFLMEADTQGTNDFSGYFEWIDAMYAAVPDLGAYYDAVAVHPYSEKAPDYYTPGTSRWEFRRIEEIRAGLARHGDGAKHLWITEVGWATCPGSSRCNSEAEQAAYYRRAVDMVRSGYGYVDAMFFYGWRDVGRGDPADKEQWFGMVRRDGSHKPAFDALKAIATA